VKYTEKAVQTPAPFSSRPIVLVIDDEPLIRWSLAEGLTEGGFDVQVAGTGAEARATLAAAAGKRIVILLDVRLPDVADLSLLREIRSRWPAAPVIVITAHGTDRDQADAAALGAFSFVQKPFDVTEIVRLVGEATELRPT
jgi:two-component system response regulator GlrR